MAELEASPRRDPHNWNSLDNYRLLHEKHLDAHPFVLANGWDLTFHYTSLPFSQFDAIRLEGIVLCTNGIVLEITKEGDVDRTQAHRVRMSRFRYNAHFPGGENVLRYDNMHSDEPDVYHRHVSDPETGDQVSFSTLTRAQFPVMHEILDELMRMFPSS